MPRKLRDIIADMRAADFEYLPGRGKGDHGVWRHPLAPQNQITLDGRPGADAKHYQERDLRIALAVVEQAKKAAQKD